MKSNCMNKSEKKRNQEKIEQSKPNFFTSKMNECFKFFKNYYLKTSVKVILHFSSLFVKSCDNSSINLVTFDAGVLHTVLNEV